MISAVAFVPQAPLLVPALTGGSSPELDELRAACRTAIRDVATRGRRIVLFGEGPQDAPVGASARGSFASFGAPLEVALGTDERPETSLRLPPSLTVGAWLVRDALGPDSGATGHSLGVDLTHALLQEPTDAALIVLGDGSACRTLKAPGYLDERAQPFDAAIADALRRGDAAALRSAADREESAALLASGARAWRTAGRLLDGRRWDADLRYDAAPFGVGYFVAVWTGR